MTFLKVVSLCYIIRKYVSYYKLIIMVIRVFSGQGGLKIISTPRFYVPSNIFRQAKELFLLKIF